MSADLDALWRKLLDEGKAEWRPGMLDGVFDERVDHICGTTGEPVFMELDTHWDDSFNSSYQASRVDRRSVPHWTDPATLGALLGLVRERWGQPNLSGPVYVDGDLGFVTSYWLVWPGTTTDQFRASTEAGALLRALEAAP